LAKYKLYLTIIMMRRCLVLVILIFGGQVCRGQFRNNFSLVYAATATQVATTGNFPKDENYNYNYTITSGARIGLGYTRCIFKWFAVETDLLYMRNNAAIHDAYNNVIIHSLVNLASIQGFVKISFLKYLFVDGGIAADSELDQNNSMMYDQAGVAAEAGIGVKISFNRITLSLNPYMRTHGNITLGKVESNNELDERGIKFSVGYDF
jgi:hypothetical protein